MPRTYVRNLVLPETPGPGCDPRASGPLARSERAAFAPTGHPALAPAWGWKVQDGGRAVHVTPGVEYQATTTQLCGLYPFVAGSGTPVVGTPVGRHQLWGEVACLDPLAWLRPAWSPTPACSSSASRELGNQPW